MHRNRLAIICSTCALIVNYFEQFLIKKHKNQNNNEKKDLIGVQIAWQIGFFKARSHTIVRVCKENTFHLHAYIFTNTHKYVCTYGRVYYIK